MGSSDMYVHFVPVRANHMLTQRQTVTLKLEVETEMGQNRTYHHLDTAVKSGRFGSIREGGRGAYISLR